MPEALRDPEAYDPTRLPDGTKTVSLVYKGPVSLLVQVFRARATPFIQKTLGSAPSKARPVPPDGYWITASPGFAYQSASRVRIRTAAARGQDPADRA